MGTGELERKGGSVGVLWGNVCLEEPVVGVRLFGERSEGEEEVSTFVFSARGIG